MMRPGEDPGASQESMGILRQKVRRLADAAASRTALLTNRKHRDGDKLIFADDVDYWRSGITPSRQGLLYRCAKRVIDLVFATVFLVIGAPWLLVCGLLMQREAPGPPFYRQERVGKDGRILTVYKLRSMPVDAEEQGPQLTPIEGDRRIGPVGRFIRKAKIDELPQFWNVLLGQVSVVGPRPERPYFVERFSKVHPLFPFRHLVKPGLTGLAQVNEMDAFRIRHKLRYDIFYVRKHSLGLDLWILWRTAMYCFKCLFTGFNEVANGKAVG